MNETERQFFETFEIKPKSYLLCTSGWDCIDAQPCEQCHYGKLIEDEYPQITDRILLELICIANHESVYIDFEGTDVETLKNSLLGNFVYFKRIIPKRKVQALFKDV